MSRIAVLIFPASAVPQPVPAQAGESSPQQDQICRLLFDHYLSRPVKNYNLSTCSVAALRHISGRDELTTRAEWQEWWRNANRLKLPVRPVRLEDP
jgi:hypothetical protein